MHAGIDLDAYFARIGYTGPRTPTLATLHAITAAHAETIPFENLDVLLGRPIVLEPDAIFAKLVTRRRGGYCFEQNGLLMEVLEALGFAVRPLSARVRSREPDRSIPVPRTHLLLEVTLAGERWITDVGVGSTSLTAALRLEPDRVQTTPHEPRRLQYANQRWYHQIERDGAWTDVCEFTGETMPLIDRVVASWYTSTHPASSFHSHLVVARANPDGTRSTLLDAVLALRDNAGPRWQRTLADAAALRAALAEHFGITLEPDAHLPAFTA